MGCYSTILVALDGSADAAAALQHAASLARDQHACLVVMTVAPPPMLLFGGIGSGATVVANLEPGYLRELHQAVASLPPDVGVQSRFAHGAAARRILEIADECRADLIVMGFHARGRLRRALKGSASDTVARESSRPVLLVRADRAATDQAPCAGEIDDVVTDQAELAQALPAPDPDQSHGTPAPSRS